MNKFPCVLMRGGTSKAVFFHENNMPDNMDEWENFLLDVMGSPDKTQIDGLGGANSLTSKVAIIKKSDRPGVDVDYTFGQVSLEDRKVDFKGNCGNISSAVAPFSIDEEIVNSNSDKTIVKIYNTNTNKIIESIVNVKDNRFDPDGDCVIPGVPEAGSEIIMYFHDPVGAVTGKVLPTGNPIDYVNTSVGEIGISIVDAANPLVFIKAIDIGFRGDELPSDYNKGRLMLLEEIRSIAAELCGFAKKEDATKKSPAVPKTTIIAEPMDYVDVKGKKWKAEDMDILIRMMSMQKPHNALALTGAICTTLAAKIEGTIVNQIIKSTGGELRLGHPGGIMKTYSKTEEDGTNSVGAVRTARRLMEGYVYTKKNYKKGGGKHEKD
jgi:hypothetical protein